MNISNRFSKIRTVDRSTLVPRLLVPAGIIAGGALWGLAVLILYTHNA